MGLDGRKDKNIRTGSDWTFSPAEAGVFVTERLEAVESPVNRGGYRMCMCSEDI